MSSKIKKRLQYGILGLLTLTLLAFLGFWSYVGLASYPPTDKFLQQAYDHPQIKITQNRKYYAITPKQTETRTSFIYYSGGLVDPESYLYPLSKLAVELKSEFYLIRPRFNAAILDINAAQTVFQQAEITQAIIGGHSLGGVAACSFTQNNPDKINGLFLFAAYCDQDISQLKMPVVSVMGERDGIMNQENYEQAKDNLPPTATIIEKEKLNHSDFGNYGLQDGDNPSQLSESEVLEIMKEALREL